jgi:GntR family transcriptional regulator / MocR family aminotransferase
VDLHISLVGRRGLSGEIYRQLRDAILEGRLRAGEALPSSRELARRLQTSRNTVVEAYERLRAEGFLVSRIGAGTFVRAGVRARTAAQPDTSPLRPRPLWDALPEMGDLSAITAEFDLRPGIPDASSFPFAAWRVRLARQMRPAAIGRGTGIDAAGDPRLRAALARHVAVSRGVRASSEQVFVTSGSQQAIDLIARVLLEPGDAVGVEDPGYPLARRAFVAHGCRVTGVPVDDEGMVVDAIPADCRCVYVTPSHQYPLGVTLSMARRQQLLAWADANDGVIIEDDYDSEFRYGGRPLEPLHCLDGGRRVLYVGSLSKVLLPTLRLGFAVVPEPLHAAVRKAKYLTDWHSPVLSQAAAAAFIDDGLLAQHIRRMRRIYAERHDRLTRALARYANGLLTPVPSRCGLHIAATFDDPTHNDRAVATRVAGRGVAVLPLAYHYVTSPPRPGLLLGYGAIASDALDEAIRRVCASVLSFTGRVLTGRR